MKKILCLTLALILALSCLSGCGSAQPQATTAAAETTAPAAEATAAAETTAEDYGTVVIQNGDRTVTFTAMPTGVLCANLYSAENMVMLGLGDYIVGKNVHTNPAEVPLEELSDAFANIPEIERSNENAVASGADLLIGQISAFKDSSWGTYEQLESEGINCLTITGTIVPDETVEDIYTDIENLGKIFKVEDKAAALIAQMKASIADTNGKVAGGQAQGIRLRQQQGGSDLHHLLRPGKQPDRAGRRYQHHPGSGGFPLVQHLRGDSGGRQSRYHHHQ